MGLHLALWLLNWHVWLLWCRLRHVATVWVLSHLRVLRSLWDRSMHSILRLVVMRLALGSVLYVGNVLNNNRLGLWL